MCDSSDDDVPLARVNSGPMLVDVVPADKVFKLKIVEGNGTKVKFEYVLSKGKPLPYSAEINGYKFIFSKSLDIAMEGNILWTKEAGNRFIVFTRVTDIY